MIFSLEALPAQYGDSLIVHFGETDRPRFLVIDGGPSGVYEQALQPRLKQLAATHRDEHGKLPIEVLMVSHADADHIQGILDLTEDLIANRGGQGIPIEVETLWHNFFEDAVGEHAERLTAAVAEAPARVAAVAGEPVQWTGEARAVVQSVPQARRLRDNARGLDWSLNDKFSGLVVAPESGGHPVEWGPLHGTVVAPLQPEVDALRREWEEQVRRLKTAKRKQEALVAATSIDRSVYNLSSIVCLLELDGRRMLLTGDALGRNVLEGLRRAGLLPDDGPLELDVLKLPHHGSARNIDAEFFARLRARHYVISADGRYHNPEPETLQLLSGSRDDDDFTIHLTYDRFQGTVEAEIEALLAQERTKGRRYEVVRRAPDERSLCVDLLDAVGY